MTPEAITALINLGAAGAVIAVVVIFLRFIQRQQTDWQRFFKSVMESQNQPTMKLTEAIEHLLAEFQKHDAWEHTKLDEMTDRLNAAPRRTRGKTE